MVRRTDAVKRGEYKGVAGIPLWIAVSLIITLIFLMIVVYLITRVAGGGGEPVGEGWAWSGMIPIFIRRIRDKT